MNVVDDQTCYVHVLVNRPKNCDRLTEVEQDDRSVSVDAFVH